MEFTVREIEEIKSKLFDCKCPSCGSIDKHVVKSPANFVYFIESADPENPKEYTYLTCVLAFCHKCGYVMQFNLTPAVQ